MLDASSVRSSTAAVAQAHGSAVGRILRYVPLGSCLLLAAALRVRHIGRDSLWGDEALTVLLAKMPIADLIKYNTWWEQTPPLHHLLIKVWIAIFGDSEGSLRMPSALAGVASVYVLYVLVARLLGRRIAITAALLLAVSPMELAYAQECRTYSLHVLLGLICCDVFVRLLRRPTPNLHAAYVITAALFMYSHIYAAFTLAALHLFYLLKLRRSAGKPPLRFKSLLIDDIAMLALLSPWLPVTVSWTRQVQQSSWLKKVTLDDISRAYWVFSGQTAVFVAMVALVVIAIGRWRRHAAIWLFVLIALMPVALPVPLSTLTQMAFTPRYAIMAMPGFVVLAAAGIAALRPAPLRWLVLAALAIASPLGDAAVILRPQWREMGQFLTQNMGPGDLAVIQISAGTRLYDYYVRARPDVRRIGIDTINLPVSYPLDPPGRHVWLIIYDEWHATAKMVRRAPVKIGRRKFTWCVLAMELLEDPEKFPDTTTAPAAAPAKP